MQRTEQCITVGIGKSRGKEQQKYNKNKEQQTKWNERDANKGVTTEHSFKTNEIGFRH
jgi:hypothetical protein